MEHDSEYNKDQALVLSIVRTILRNKQNLVNSKGAFIDEITHTSSNVIVHGLYRETLRKYPDDILRLRFRPVRSTTIPAILAFIQDYELYEPNELDDIVTWKSLLAKYIPEATNFCEFDAIVKSKIKHKLE